MERYKKEFEGTLTFVWKAGQLHIKYYSTPQNHAFY